MIGAGNGTPGPISGYHSGQIWQMSATHVHCSSIVVVSWPAGAIVSAFELDSDAAHSAIVKGAARGRRSPAVACWASDHWVAGSNPLRGSFVINFASLSPASAWPSLA